MKKILAIVLLAAIGSAQGQYYPAKPVKIIVPCHAGQGTDVATRHFAEHLTRNLGQSFFVENRPGAGANIGTEAGGQVAARRLHADRPTYEAGKTGSAPAGLIVRLRQRACENSFMRAR